MFEYLASDKTYIAEILFGIKTDTDDITGVRIDQKDHIPDQNSIQDIIKLFTGKIKQKPPIYSAIKVNGKKAYELARKGQLEPEAMKERIIDIYSIDLLSFHQKTLKLKVHCSSGTYIRSLARDIGKNLGTVSTLSKLERTNIGNFDLNNSVDPHSLTSDNIANHIILPNSVLPLEKLELTSNELTSIQLGREIKAKNIKVSKTNLLQLVDNNDTLIAIGEISIKDMIIRPKKVFKTP